MGTIKPYQTIINYRRHKSSILPEEVGKPFWIPWNRYKTQLTALEGKKSLLQHYDIIDVKIIDTRRKSSNYYTTKNI